MEKHNLRIITIVVACVCFVVGIVLQIMEKTRIACWWIIGAGICAFILIFPASLKRISKKNTKLVNCLIIISSVVFGVVIMFVMVSMGYVGLFEDRLFSFFDYAFYPGVLVYCLLESVIDYLSHERYKDNDSDFFS